MIDYFGDFCRLCSDVYSEASMTVGEIHQLKLLDDTLEFCERDNELFCRCQVGTLEDVRDLKDLFEVLLAGNFFWCGTHGATLSLHEDVVYLTDRLAIDYFADEDVLKTYVEEFVYFLLQWRERLQLYKPSISAEVE